MGDLRSPEGAAELKAWMAQAERVAARRRQGFPEEWAGPPAGLTLSDFEDAGFEFYQQGSGRYASGSTFHVNFSPDLQHQAVLLTSPEGSLTARLWVDGSEVRVPVDLSGDPRADAVTRWLDAYFSRGALHDVESVARAVSLRLWCSEVRRMATQTSHSFTLQHPAPPLGLTPKECGSLGFGFHDERTTYNFLDDDEKTIVRIAFSPDLQHQAVLLRAGDDWTGALLWVDGEQPQVPRGKDGDPMCEHIAHWLDNRFVYVQVGGLWDHPLSDPSARDPLGNIFGLLVFDVVQHAADLVLPQSAQAWTNPIITVRGGLLRVYSDQKAAAQDRADRVLPIAS